MKTYEWKNTRESDRIKQKTNNYASKNCYYKEKQNSCWGGVSYDYSDDEVEEFMLAKFFKDCGYTYPEIKKEMKRYRNNKNEVLDEIISKMESKVEDLKQVIKKAKALKEEN